MNGQELAELQEESGVRGVVKDIDALRVKLGLDCVTMRTPRAEVTVRSGYQARIPLKVACRLQYEAANVVLGFPMGYPEEEMLEIDSCKCDDGDHELEGALLEYLQGVREDVAAEAAEHGQGEYAVSIIDAAKIFVGEWRSKQIDDLADSVDDDAAANDVDSIQTSDNKIKAYSCRLCRCYLFCDNDLDPHEGHLNCSTLFISEPPVPVPNNEEEGGVSLGGKLACPQCGAKLGSWCWVGTQCSCESSCYSLVVSVTNLISHHLFRLNVGSARLPCAREQVRSPVGGC